MDWGSQTKWLSDKRMGDSRALRFGDRWPIGHLAAEQAARGFLMAFQKAFQQEDTQDASLAVTLP